MADVVSTAGRAAQSPAPQDTSSKKLALQAIARVLRNQSASEEDTEDALEALTELSKE